MGVKAHVVVSIQNPDNCSTKGAVSCSSWIKSASRKGKDKAKARTKRKVPFKQRWCGVVIMDN